MAALQIVSILGLVIASIYMGNAGIITGNNIQGVPANISGNNIGNVASGDAILSANNIPISASNNNIANPQVGLVGLPALAGLLPTGVLSSIPLGALPVGSLPVGSLPAGLPNPTGLASNPTGALGQSGLPAVGGVAPQIKRK